MFVTEKEARTKWCAFVHIDGNNRVFNTMTDGFTNAPQPYHCIGNECMQWRQMVGTHLKPGATAFVEGHGYCGLGRRPELE